MNAILTITEPGAQRKKRRHDKQGIAPGLLKRALRPDHYHSLDTPADHSDASEWREACASRHHLCTLLAKPARVDGSSHALMLRLFNCTSIAPCLSCACPICQKAIQKWGTEAAAHWLKKVGKPVKFVTLIPDVSDFSKSPLTPEVIKLLRRQLSQALSTCNFGPCFFFLDFCIHAGKSDADDYYWQPHWHGFTLEGEVAQYRNKLREAFPKKDRDIERPIHSKLWDGNISAAQYIFKFQFDRKLWTDGADNQPATSHSNDLTNNQILQIVTLLDQVSLEDLLLLHNTKVVKFSDGRRLLKPIADE